jgi:hypothetical protein
MGERRRRRCIEPIDDWEQLELLCQWPERLTYEEIRPLVVSRWPTRRGNGSASRWTASR